VTEHGEGETRAWGEKKSPGGGKKKRRRGRAGHVGKLKGKNKEKPKGTEEGKSPWRRAAMFHGKRNEKVPLGEGTDQRK